MNDDQSFSPERYEIFEKPPYHFEIDRRQLLKFFGGGILLAFPLSQLWAQHPGGSPDHASQEIGAWIHIDPNGSIRVFTGKVEMGQNIRTSLTQAVADELHIPVSMIHLLMGDTDQTPFDMGTFGSRTTPTMAPQLRRAAAAAREVLIELAAHRWNIEPAAVRIADGRFINNRADESLTFADLAKDQNLLKIIPEDAQTTAPEHWTIAGTSVPKISARDFVTGKHQYTSDMKPPGTLYGVVVRPTAFRARLVSADTSGAEKMPSVVVVRDGDFIGVAAPDPLTAQRAAKSVQAKWEAPAQPSNAQLFDLLQQPPKEGGDDHWRQNEPEIHGSIADGFASAHKTLEQTYTVAYIAHTPLEPRATLAEWKADRLTVWTGTQRPFAVRTQLAEAFRIPEEKVRVIVPDTGSAYGGKHTGECAIEAARIARAADKPVKLVWSREEEFTWAYFRPAGIIRVKSGVAADGSITAWEFHNYNSGPAAIYHKYNFENQHLEFHPGDSPLRQGSYRGLAATANHFARETHIDELAAAMKTDPLVFRLKNTKDERLRGVVQAAANQFGWGKRKLPAGIACGFEKGSYVATCAEITVKANAVKIVRVVEAFDCGAVVNANHLKNQIEGAIMMGIGGALFEQIKFANGKILNAQLSSYRVPRFSDSPASVEIVVVDRKDVPSAGAGETPIVSIAPAIGNAIFQATGTRLRAMPLVPNGLPA